MHSLEAPDMDPYLHPRPLVLPDTEDAKARLAKITAIGYKLDRNVLIDAVPTADFDPKGFVTVSAAPTSTLDEGDVIDLGDRVFEILHLPGHTRGSIGLWEAATKTLFSGDAIYDGPLIDFLPESDRSAYLRTMRRLRDVPAGIVHGGHDPSFGRDKLIELVDQYLVANG
jgi:glyoxylase-like metal-dependent hydrolase (beta-lactamase superfamily II)